MLGGESPGDDEKRSAVDYRWECGTAHQRTDRGSGIADEWAPFGMADQRGYGYWEMKSGLADQLAQFGIAYQGAQRGMMHQRAPFDMAEQRRYGY
jgi:hypothetical protein